MSVPVQWQLPATYLCIVLLVQVLVGVWGGGLFLLACWAKWSCAHWVQRTNRFRAGADR